MSDARPQIELPGLEEFSKLRAEMPGGVLAMLDSREQMFVALLLRDPDLNRTRTAIACGYPKRSAKQRAHEILRRPIIKDALDAAIKARLARVETDADRVLREVDTVATSCISDYELTDDGNVTLRPHAHPDAMRAIRSIKRKTRVITKGDLTETTYDVELTLWDKPNTLRLAMQHRGMLVETHRVIAGGGVLAVPMAPDAEQWGTGAAAQQAALVARPPTVAAVES